MIEARCQKCGETFNPHPSDGEGWLTHYADEMGDECGGDGVVVGDYVPAATNRCVIIPPVFFEDHVARDLMAHPFNVTPKGKRIVVECHVDDLADLLSDARHYATTEDYDGGLRTSARATVRAIEHAWEGVTR